MIKRSYDGLEKIVHNDLPTKICTNGIHVHPICIEKNEIDINKHCVVVLPVVVQ